MTMHNTDIIGMGYFPGQALGKLHRGMNGEITQCIVLLRQDEITSFSTLPAGFIVVEAAPFSHTLVTLVGLGVPTVLISAQQAATLKNGVTLLINGVSGKITDNITEHLETSSPVVEDSTKRMTATAVLMADGEAVNLSASVRHPSAARQAVELGAKDIGLVRSEFLLPPDGGVPDAAFYHYAFREVCQEASPLTVTLRLLDVAADKVPAWFPHSDTFTGALGFQGVRLYSMDSVENVIDAQLAAFLDLSNDYNLRLLIPFLTRVEEYEYWLEQIRQQLPDHVPVGAMAETPASVLDIARLLESADFVAIGCNDLMQGLYAADRDQPELRHYLDPYAPVLFRLFRQVAEQSAELIQNIQLCGLLAQIKGVLPVLLGLGYRNFSVDAPFIPYLENIVAGTTRADCETLAAQVCAARTSKEVLDILQLPTGRHSPFLFKKQS